MEKQLGDQNCQNQKKIMQHKDTCRDQLTLWERKEYIHYIKSSLNLTPKFNPRT